MIKVHQHGLLPPCANARLVWDQIHKAHRYRNLLVEIECARRIAVRTLVGVKGAPLKPHQAQIDIINGLAADLRRGARALCACYWGTYQLVEDADQAMRKMPLWDDPRFVSWAGEGAVSVQLQGGLAPQLLTTDTQVQVLPRAAPLTRGPRQGQTPSTRKLLKLRVGSIKGKPVWAEWPLILDRDIPTSAIIKRVTVHCHRQGPRVTWSVEFTLDLPDVFNSTLDLSNCVGVDLGWRVSATGLRVCAWSDEIGTRAGELQLSEYDQGGFVRVDSLRSTRDQNFLAALKVLLSHRLQWPVGFRIKNMGQWRSPERLTKLVKFWRTCRFTGDALAFQQADQWRYHNEHLYRWEADQRMRTLRARREKYRLFAHTLVQQFDVLVLEQFDLRTFATRPTPADPIIDKVGRRETQQEEKARAYRHMAATSSLRLILENAFKSKGKLAVRISAHYTTKICHDCKHIEHFNAAKDITHACTRCGVVWDQDDNAAKNLCERYRTGQTAGSARIANTAESAEKVETRWARAKRMSHEKLTARNISSNGAE